MAGRVLRTEKDIADWSGFLAKQPLPMTVSHAKGAKTSKQQNRTIHMWYGQIAGFQGDITPSEAKGQSKLLVGLPIMQAHDPAWVQEWEPMYGPIKDHELKCKLFVVLPMTSVMGAPLVRMYMDHLQLYYRPMGCPLTDPEMMKYEAQCP